MSQTHEFGQVAERQDRMAILQQWVDGMDFDERCAVTAMIAKRNDHLPTLPIELIIEILSHLPIFAAWRLQPVNQRWRSLFSIEKILRASLARWDSHNKSDSARDPSLMAQESIASKVRRMQALRLGDVFLKARLRCKFPRFHRLGQSIVLKGSRIAYICGSGSEGHSVVVNELLTGRSSVLRGEARESISSIALGSDAVAFATHSGKLYAQDLSVTTRPTRSVRLPSASVLAMHVDEKTVALALNRGTTVALYNIETGSLRCFDVVFDTLLPAQVTDPGPHWDVSLLVNCHRGIVDVFKHTKVRHRDRQCRADLEWEHVRYSFKGQRMIESCLHVPDQHLMHSEWVNKPPREADYCVPLPSGYDGVYNIGNVLNWPFHRTCEHPDPTSRCGELGDSDKYLPSQIYFDSKLAKFRRDFIEGLDESCASNPQQETEITRWKDAQFNMSSDTLETRNLVNSSSRVRSLTKLETEPRKSVIVGVNDSFLVTMGVAWHQEAGQVHDVSVHCFDVDLKEDACEDTAG